LGAGCPDRKERRFVFTLGIDVGGTFARAAVVAVDGRLVSVDKHALKARSPDAVVESVGEAVARALEGAPGVEVAGCGVGVAGQLDPATGRVRVAPNLGWRDVPFGEMLSSRLGRRVWLVNDLSAAAYGEFSVGAGRGERDLLTVFIGTGVGSALIANGLLVSGSGGVAGEMGHTKVVFEGGRRCGCGETGCLEAYAGGANLIAQAREAVTSGESKRLLELAGGELDQLTPMHLERAALEGDAGALRIYDQARRFLGIAISNQVTMLNPARLILGGGVLVRCPGLRRSVTESVARWSSRASQEDFTIADALLGDDSGLMGAGLLAAQFVQAERRITH
jgi:glucokinase